MQGDEMVYWDEQGNTVEISKADQLWLDDGYFKTQQAHLPPDAPRAALSYRVSTKGQVDHNDIPMQKIKCRKFAQQQGWRVVMEKAEKGISGSKVSASKRDVIQELRQEAGNGSFDICLTGWGASKARPPLCWNGLSSMASRCGASTRASSGSRATAIS